MDVSRPDAGKQHKLKEVADLPEEAKKPKRSRLRTNKNYKGKRDATLTEVTKEELRVVKDAGKKALELSNISASERKVTPTASEQSTDVLLEKAKSQILESFQQIAEKQPRQTILDRIKTFFAYGKIGKINRQIIKSLDVFNTKEMQVYTDDAAILTMYKSIKEELNSNKTWTKAVNKQLLKTANIAFAQYLYQRVDRLLLTPPKETNNLNNLQDALVIMDNFKNEGILINLANTDHDDKKMGMTFMPLHFSYRCDIAAHFAGRFKIAIGDFFTREIKPGTLETKVTEFSEVAKRIGGHIDALRKTTPNPISKIKQILAKRKLSSCYKLFEMNYEMHVKNVDHGAIKKGSVMEYYDTFCEDFDNYAKDNRSVKNEIEKYNEHIRNSENKSDRSIYTQLKGYLRRYILREGRAYKESILFNTIFSLKQRQSEFSNYYDVINVRLGQQVASRATTQQEHDTITQKAATEEKFVAIVNEAQIKELTELGVDEDLAKKEITAVSKDGYFIADEMKMCFLSLAIKKMTKDMKEGDLLKSFTSTRAEYKDVLSDLLVHRDAGMGQEPVVTATNDDNTILNGDHYEQLLSAATASSDGGYDSADSGDEETAPVQKKQQPDSSKPVQTASRGSKDDSTDV